MATRSGRSATHLTPRAGSRSRSRPPSRQRAVPKRRGPPTRARERARTSSRPRWRVRYSHIFVPRRGALGKRRSRGNQVNFASAPRSSRRGSFGSPGLFFTKRTTSVVRALTVAFQGEPGAFSEEAVHAFFGDQPETRAVPSWRSVFEAVRDGEATAGVVAIESSLAGSIRETYDLSRSSTTTGSGSSARRAFRCDSPSWPCPASRSTRSSASTATPRRGPGRRVPSLPGLGGVTTYNTAGAARMIAETASGAPRRSPRRASPKSTASRSWRTTSRPATKPDAVRDPRPRGNTRSTCPPPGGRRPPPDDPGLRGPKRARIGSTAVGEFAARGVNLSRLESARRGARNGSTCSGWTSTPMRPILIARRPSRPSAVSRRW